MKLNSFKLERYFAKYEFRAKYLLSSSDCGGYPMSDLLKLATADEIDKWNNLKLGYTDSQGLPELRDEISKLYKTISAQQVLVSVPEEGIFIAMNNLLATNDHVICIAPAYQSLSEIVKSVGCDISYWLPDEEKSWHFDVEELTKLINNRTKLLIINFPHNPTGFNPSLDEYLRIFEIASKYNLYVFSDEMYRFLEHQPNATLPFACDLYRNAISLFGMSKTFGLAGLRIGWLATQNDELMNRFFSFKDYTTICNSAPSEVLALIALCHKENLINYHLTTIYRNLALLDNFFMRNKQLISWNKPTAGTIGFAKLHTEMSSFEFCEQLVKQTGIMLVPSEMFDYNTKYVRIGFGRVDMPETLEKFEEYLQNC